MKVNKMAVQLAMAVIMVLCGAVLLFLGFYAPPIGSISSSVLTALGEILTFSGSLFGIDYKYKFKKYKLDSESEKNESDE